MPAKCARSTSSQHSLLGVLAEAMVAVYMGLCVCALYTRDSCALYRLACSARLADSLTWSRVFGGVCRLKPLRPPAPPTRPSSTFSSPSPQPKKRGYVALTRHANLTSYLPWEWNASTAPLAVCLLLGHTSTLPLPNFVMRMCQLTMILSWKWGYHRCIWGLRTLCVHSVLEEVD